MISVNIHLHPGDVTPTVKTIRTRDERRFLVLDLGACSISLPGYDGDSAAAARVIAAALLTAAEALAPLAPNPEQAVAS